MKEIKGKGNKMGKRKDQQRERPTKERGRIAKGKKKKANREEGGGSKREKKKVQGEEEKKVNGRGEKRSMGGLYPGPGSIELPYHQDKLNKQSS